CRALPGCGRMPHRYSERNLRLDDRRHVCAAGDPHEPDGKEARPRRVGALAAHAHPRRKRAGRTRRSIATPRTEPSMNRKIAISLGTGALAVAAAVVLPANAQ